MNSIWKIKVAQPDTIMLLQFKEERMIVGLESGHGNVCDGHWV